MLGRSLPALLKHVNAKPGVTTYLYPLDRGIFCREYNHSPDQGSFHQPTCTLPKTNMTTTTESIPPVQCRLLSLPPELRNRIWDTTLNEVSNRQASIKVVHDRQVERICQPKLLQVCRQIRAEVLPMYYSSTTFRFEPWYDVGIKFGELWLRAVHEHAEYIQHVQLCAQLNTSSG